MASNLRIADLKDSRILIVDDQTANLKILKTVLGIAGYSNVNCLDDSRQVIPVVVEFQPDLILLDLHMPHVDGLDVMDQLAGVIHEDDYVPILVLTGDGSPKAKEKALSHGAQDFLSKPLNATEVHLRVKNLLQTRHLHLQLKAQNLSLEQQVRERTDLAEALRRAKEEAERANRAKSDFLSRMSHELRTPLNSILGFAQILELSYLTPKQTDSVQHIFTGGQHLLELINEVLDVARIEAGRLTLSLEPVRLPDVIREALDVVRPIAQQRHITIQAHVAFNQHVKADRQRLRQVLLNLFSNAIKYNVEGGRIDIRYEKIGTDLVRIGVTDTGLGIAEEARGRLFQPFERLQDERRHVEGTGLGLALCRGLMEAMGGRIGVDSTVGQGSTFWLELAALDQVGEPRAESRPRTVLYVEDNPSNFTLMEHILALRPEVHLIAATHGQAGIDLARTEQPDLILLDLHLPDLPGGDVLRHLKGDPVTADIPVTIVTADATPQQVESLRDSGARSYLTKPVDVGSVLRLVDSLRSEADELEPIETIK